VICTLDLEWFFNRFNITPPFPIYQQRNHVPFSHTSHRIKRCWRGGRQLHSGTITWQYKGRNQKTQTGW